MRTLLFCLASLSLALPAAAQDVVIAQGGKTAAVVAVSPQAGEWEARAAADLVEYIERLSGAKPALAKTDAEIQAALAKPAPVILVGQAALAADPTLAAALTKVAKPKPVLRADAIVLRAKGNRIYLAGANDECHYYAAVELLTRWGCRWYFPTEFGECIPSRPDLSLPATDYAYAPPFEARRYWLSWNGDNRGRAEFSRRNRFNEVMVPNGHILAKYTGDLTPPGKTPFNVPVTDDKTADHVAKQVLPLFAAGKDVQLGMEDGLYESDSPLDKELVALQYDKYFLTQSMTDAFFVFYNKVADRLLAQAPNSKAKIGFLAYGNLTIPPVRDVTARSPLVAYLAPIDIDPIHGMDDLRSGPKQELKAMVTRWAKVMEGRVVIYDYDQSMLVWRDIPNPSHHAVQQDFKHYRQAGILGVDTESRGATATTFLNLYFRGQLAWNPDADVDAMLAEFYVNFYGPAAKPMAAYWNAINKAWVDTLVTEHEYFVVPAVYTPELVEALRKHLAAAEAALAPIAQKSAPSAQEQMLLKRLAFTKLGFEVLDHYTAMVRAAARDVDYATAAAEGAKGLAAREKLTALDGTFTTYKQIGESGYAWWPGEVQQYRELLPLVDGTQGKLIATAPLVWGFRRDAKDEGVKAGWAKERADLSAWQGKDSPDAAARLAKAGGWEPIHSDVYLQGQGVITADNQSFTGHGWYQTDLELTADQVAGKVHLMFPGVFNECWLYINGVEVAHRPFKGVWWMNDYRFQWDVDLAGKLQAGKNSVTLRIFNPHHMGGMFRRPFLYRAEK